MLSLGVGNSLREALRRAYQRDLTVSPVTKTQSQTRILHFIWSFFVIKCDEELSFNQRRSTFKNNYILFAIVLVQLIKLEFLGQQVELKCLMLNK